MGLHGFLLLIMFLGSAFFIQQQRSVEQPRVRVVPGILIDQALAGGGGNPSIAKTDDQQKGDTTVPKPKPPAPEPPKVVQPKPEKIVEPPPPKPDKPKVTKETPPPKPTAIATKDSDFKPLDLKPATRPKVDPQKVAAAAEAKRRQEIADKVAKQLGNVEQSLRSGFKGGTKMEVWGPGGEAYAGYEAFVKAVYDDAWDTSDPSLNDQSTVRVSVTIAKSGDVISAHIDRRSANSPLDRSVQRAIDKVRALVR